jgi:quercetin dioxygenase-like cupin family protein
VSEGRPAAAASTSRDDERVRVTTWTFPGAGASTGAHVHELDYVVVPVTGGTFDVTAPDGSVTAMRQAAGEPYAGTAGTAHEVTSTGEGVAVFVEVELKR